MKTLFRSGRRSIGIVASLLLTTVLIGGEPAGDAKTDEPAGRRVQKHAVPQKSAPRRKTSPKSKSVAVPARKVAVTGSHIRQHKNASNQTSISPLTVLDRRTIESSGAGDLATLLRMRIPR